jgi:glycyl-tRNA synthetase
LKKFVEYRREMYAMDDAILMNSKDWEDSGHVALFSDPLVECEKCKKRFRVDQIEDKKKCPECGGALGDVRQFNMMFATKIGAMEDSAATVYLRPETAQGMFVNFKNTVDAFHPKLPFGMAQIGKAFRNEITPRDFLFRQREFEQMEIEYFVRPADWEKYFEYWKNEMLSWMEEIGLDMSKVHELEVAKEDRAHYSSRTVDFEFEYPFGKKELFGLAYRTDFDLKNHGLEYIDEEKAEKMVPHVIEPTFGVDRAVLSLLLSVYAEDEKDGEVRSYLKFKPNIAPVICAVSPLLKNKPELVEYANTKVFAPLKEEFGRVAWDDNGNIGKRYRRQDEIGTPFCIVVDFDTPTDNSVTVRDRDTGAQERVKVEDLKNYIKEKI